MVIFYSPSLNGFFDPDICQPPEDAVEIPPALHTLLLNGQGQGKRIVGGPDGLPILETVTVPLEEIRAQLCAEIDFQAERQRAKHITPGAGQAMTYLAKADEARRAVADGAAADNADYPLLAAEIGITAAGLLEVAAVVLAAHQAWQVAGAAIEAARIAGKVAVLGAADITTAEAAAAAVAWPD